MPAVLVGCKCLSCVLCCVLMVVLGRVTPARGAVEAPNITGERRQRSETEVSGNPRPRLRRHIEDLSERMSDVSMSTAGSPNLVPYPYASQPPDLTSLVAPPGAQNRHTYGVLRGSKDEL